jgi:hypothetical protein
VWVWVCAREHVCACMYFSSDALEMQFKTFVN